MNYYNEFNPHAAQWLRNLISAGQIPKGHVDERSIELVKPDDLTGFSQCHFFAGIGGWSLALRLAGWPEDREIWTGSCPCQPFSVAGKGKGEADPRHLWPQLRRLISECGPPVVFGEQVAQAAGRLWLNGVRTDLEGMGYAVGATDLCAAGVGAPHIRQRLYWLADSAREGLQRRTGGWLPGARRAPEQFTCRNGLVLASQPGLERLSGDGDNRDEPGWIGAKPGGSVATTGTACGVGNSQSVEQQGERESVTVGGRDGEAGGSGSRSGSEWGDFRLTHCRDGKARRVKSGLQCLVAGLPKGVVRSSDPGAPLDAESTSEARVMRLQGYGNAIVPPLAAEVIAAYMEATERPPE